MSSVEGSLEPPLSNLTLPKYFASEVLAQYSTRPALICPQESPRPHGGPSSHNLGLSKYLAWDFAELDRHVEALARGLIMLGTQRGDRLGIIAGNTR